MKILNNIAYKKFIYNYRVKFTDGSVVDLQSLAFRVQFLLNSYKTLINNLNGITLSFSFTTNKVAY